MTSPASPDATSTAPTSTAPTTLRGVLAIALRQIVIVTIAVVVIGGMGSIMGAIVTGLGLGVIEGLTKVFYPEASATVVFVIMVIVLLVRPAGLFGKAK